MESLNQQKLKSILASRNLNLNQVCRQAGVSRQSIYNMMKGASIYNTPFQKLLTILGIEPSALTTVETVQDLILKKAPFKIKKTALQLRNFCQKNHASLVLFGSQAVGKAQYRSDWDFGVYFHRSQPMGKLSLFKQKLVDLAFPQRIDVVCLNHAPEWFYHSVKDDAVCLWGRPMPPNARKNHELKKTEAASQKL